MTKENIQNEDFRFYILMRSDLDSMNAGKACAQAAHAQRHADSLILESGQYIDQIEDYKSWCQQTTQSFGTTICLEVDAIQLSEVTEFLSKFTKIPSGKIHDPTYPLLDGNFLHLIPLDTCGWAFGKAADLKPIFSRFNLHP